MCQDTWGAGEKHFFELWWWGGKWRKCSGFLGYLLGGIPAQLREKSETASKVVDSLRHHKGGGLRACFAFFAPLGMYPKDPRIFSVFLTTVGVVFPCLFRTKKDAQGVFSIRKQENYIFSAVCTGTWWLRFWKELWKAKNTTDSRARPAMM